LLVYLETLSSSVICLTSTGDDSLLVYTSDNVLYHFIIKTTDASVRLVQAGHITFNGLIRAPARVRALSWIVPDDQLRDGDPSRDVAVATIIFLLDGKLVLLQPSTTEGGDLKYDMRVLLQHVEYFALMRDQPPQLPFPGTVKPPETFELEGSAVSGAESTLSDALWVFDGTDVKVCRSTKSLFVLILMRADLD